MDTKTLLSLGTKVAWLVHGSDGTDELSISGLSYVIELKNGIINKFTLKGLSLFTYPIPLNKLFKVNQQRETK